MPPLLLTLALLAAPPAPSDRHVYVGIYLNDVSDFDLKAGRFKADLRVWVKWLGAPEVPPLEFENGELDSKEELARESDGAWHSVQWRAQGTFRGDFPVHRFPFDQQELPVRFSLPRVEGELLPDLGASSMSPSFSITGWLFSPSFQAATSARRFGSDLGSVHHEGDDATVQSVVFTVQMARPLQPYLLKFLLPLGMILGMAVLALFLPVAALAERSAMGVTALLSCIAFHFTQSDTLPNVSYLVTADKLFLGAYVLVGGTLVFTVVGFNLRERASRLTVWLDRLGYVLLPAAALSGVLSLLSAAAPPPATATPAPAALTSTRSTLRLGTTLLARRNAFVPALTRRGLTVRDAAGALQPFLVEQAPSMTNGLVQLLPDGGMRVRWRLKPGLRWSDGAPLTSADLEYTLSLAPDPDRRAVVRVDERTLEVEYVNRDAERVRWGSVQPAHRTAALFSDGGVEKVSEAAYELGAAGTGPYVLTELVEKQRARFARNPHFSGPPAAFEAVEVTCFPSGEAMAEALTAGAIDLLTGPPSTAIAALRADAALQELRQPGDTLVFLQPDVAAAPLDQVGFRRALFAALDREALVRALAPLPVQVPRALRPGDPPVLPAARDLEGARRLVKELGLQGAKLKLFAMKATGSGPDVSALVAQQLREAGLAAEVVETEQLQPLWQKRSHGGLLLYTRDVSNLRSFFNLPWLGQGRVDTRVLPGVWDEPQRALWARAQTTFYVERRDQLEHQLAALWAERLPVLPLYFTDRLSFAAAALRGPEYGESDSLFWNVERWRTE